MKKIKNNKGITLVALIITIIVLLILAAVAISAVNGDGIISKAKLARTNYQAAQDEENTMLGKYLTDIENANNNEIKNKFYYYHLGDFEVIIEEKETGPRVYGKGDDMFFYTDEPAEEPIDISNGIKFKEGKKTDDIDATEKIEAGKFPNGIWYRYFGSVYLIKDGNNWWHWDTNTRVRGTDDEFVKFEIIDSYDTTEAQDFSTFK